MARQYPFKNNWIDVEEENSVEESFCCDASDASDQEPRGHRNLAIRGGVASLHGFLTLILIAFDIDVSHNLLTSFCQFASSLTLFCQWQTANPWMMVARAIPSYVRCALALHSSVCGRTWPTGWFGQSTECDTAAWRDDRLPLRVILCLSSLRFFLNGLSLLLQFSYPRRGVGVRGNRQLFYRGFVRAWGIPLHVLLGIIKLGSLVGTPWERSLVEISVHFMRAFFLTPISSWSLLQQWVLAGAGMRTDDIRTCFEGEKSPDVLDSFADYIEPHQGHRNLLIRSVMALCQCGLSASLVVYRIDVPHKSLLVICQFCSAVALLAQWRSHNNCMFLLRAFLSCIRAAGLVHLAMCGRVWPWEACEEQAWHDIRRPFRLLHVYAAARMLLNALSLSLQSFFPNKGVTDFHGNEQLFYRGCIRVAGIPLYLSRGVYKIVALIGTVWQREALEIGIDFIRALVIVPIQSWSLFDQWRYSGRREKSE